MWVRVWVGVWLSVWRNCGLGGGYARVRMSVYRCCGARVVRCVVEYVGGWMLL